jgi:DNA-directed RNA polymerase specialized sigma24 family protein
MTSDALTDLAGQIAALPHLPAVERATRARALVDRAKSVLAEAGDEAVVEAARSMGYREAATALGVSESAVNKAVTRQRARQQKMP